MVTAAYYLVANLGLRFALVRGQVTPLWPPTGVALVFLCWLGPRRVLPGVVVGAFLLNLPIGPSLPAVLAITAGNTLAPALAYLLLMRSRFHVTLDRFRDALALVFLGAFAGMLVSSVIGAGTLVIAGALPAEDFLPTASVWWTGDAMGVLAIAPLLLVVRGYAWRRRVRPARWVEAAALLVTTTTVTFLVMRTSVHLLFLVFPLLIWAALRFRLIRATPCALIVTVLAVTAAAGDLGPFAGLDLTAKMITLQAFNGSVALTALLLAAITAERDRARHSVDRASAELAEALSHLGPAARLRDVLLSSRETGPS